MRLASLVVLAVLVVAACGEDIVVGTYTHPPEGSPPASPVSSPPASTGGSGSIEHATGQTDVVLRFEFTGGFVTPEYLATQMPIFTLYGNRMLFVRNPNQVQFAPVGSVQSGRSFVRAILTEDQLQTLLADALGRGGLELARTDYPGQVMDLPTAVFTINAGGVSKRVAINGFGMDIGTSPDDPALAAFVALATRLEAYDNTDYNGASETFSWEPEYFRGSLLEGQAGPPGAIAWPWTTITPADFVTDPDPNGFPLPARVLSRDDIQAIGPPGFSIPSAGGFSGLRLIGPGDGKVYTLVVRPLLPDEAR